MLVFLKCVLLVSAFMDVFTLVYFQVIEDANSTEDTKKLLQFCSWENPTFSHTVLYELLWQIAFAYTHELRPYLQLLLAMLTLEDSWQHHR